MAHSLAPVAATATAHVAKSKKLISQILSLKSNTVCAYNQGPNQVLDNKHVHRRTVTLSLVAAVIGLNIDDRSANAAARRPPPPPPEEKKDPNVSGVQAKVLASKKRKEAMKQAVAKMREKGKPVDGKPSGKSVNEQPSEKPVEEQPSKKPVEEQPSEKPFEEQASPSE